MNILNYAGSTFSSFFETILYHIWLLANWLCPKSAVTAICHASSFKYPHWQRLK
jgi:hypothetical protein